VGGARTLVPSRMSLYLPMSSRFLMTRFLAASFAMSPGLRRVRGEKIEQRWPEVKKGDYVITVYALWPHFSQPEEYI
jgi:hypothetical protein